MKHTHTYPQATIHSVVLFSCLPQALRLLLTSRLKLVAFSPDNLRRVSLTGHFRQVHDTFTTYKCTTTMYGLLIKLDIRTISVEVGLEI